MVLQRLSIANTAGAYQVRLPATSKHKPVMLLQDRWYQSEAEYSVFDYFQSGKTGNPVVAMPTGTGKSVVIARIVRQIFGYWPNQRVMMLTHVKELIAQNAAKLLEVWPVAPLGIYSAGLKSRDMILPIVFGGVKSVANAIERSKADVNIPEHMRHFGWRDLLFIDECHLLSPEEDTMYQYVISELKKINPYLKVIGFTATAFRMKQGMITDGGIFTDICYDITGIEMFNRLIAEGYLSPLFARPTATQIDLSNVSVLGGEYNQKQAAAAFDQIEVMQSAVREMCEKAHDRGTWLIFASSIVNAEHIASMLQSYGIVAAASHSKLDAKENDARIAAYKRGEIRALVNMGKFTTGFDHPPIDFIGMMRATLSPGLWVQMLGRGTRPSPATMKENCLCLDFAGNAKRLGPINDPKIPNKPGKGAGDMPVRICDHCGTYNHAAARKCECCGMEFAFKVKLFATAAETPLLAGDLPIVETFEVARVVYALHEKRDKLGNLLAAPMIKATYFVGMQQLQRFDKYIGLEHNGRFKHDSREWWRRHHDEEPPQFTFEALAKTRELRSPKRIRVHVNKKYPEILGYEF
jgi:DNA repair protein RadD